MPKKPTTTEDLKKLIESGFDNSARMVGKGFQEVDKHFEEVGKRIDKVEGKIDIANEDLKKIRVRLVRIETALFSDYEKRLEKLEEDFRQFERYGIK